MSDLKNRILGSLLTVLSLSAFGQTPVGEYNFNSCDGTAVVDNINGLNGVINGATWSEGYSGQALSFDGVDDYVSIADDVTTNFGGGNFTVSYWVKKLSPSSNWYNSQGVGKWNTGASPGTNEWAISIGAQNDDFPFFSVESGTQKFQALSATALNINTWHHILGVRDGATISLFVDGVLQASVNVGTAILNDTNLPIRIARGGGAYRSNAVFDELKIYNTALTPAEIATLAGLPSAPVACVGNYDFKVGALTVPHQATWCSTSTAYTTKGMTPDGPTASCNSISPESNVWFKFQATSNEISIDLSGAISRASMTLWDETMVELECDVDYQYGEISISSVSLTVGAWYFLSVDNRLDAGVYKSTFGLCITDKASYDYKEGALEIPHQATWCSTSTAYTTKGMTADGPTASCNSVPPVSNVWFKFQATSNEVSIDLSGAISRASMTLWDESMVEWDCDIDYQYGQISIGSVSLVVGNWYYLSVDNRIDVDTYKSTFGLCITDKASYDFKEGAVEIINPGSWCSGLAEYTTLGMSADGPASSCNAISPFSNVWFKFQATGADVTINLKSQAEFGTLYRGNLTLWDDAYSELSCGNDALGNVQIDYSGLIKSSWYYISVDNYQTGGTFRKPFTLCVDNIPSNGLVYDHLELQALRDLYESTNGATWTNSTGWPTTPAEWDAVTSIDQVVGWYGITTVGGDVTHISLVNNNLSGVIPPTLGNLTSLIYLYLDNNNLSGSIPSSLGNLSSLVRLYLHANSLIGSIPAELGNLSSLSQLFLHNNVLTDSIPANLGNMSALTNMSLSGNNLSGAIPSTLGNLTNLTSLQLTGNQLSGAIPPTLGNLTSLIYLYLDNNNLSGSIPSSLGNLSSLTRLYLHANSLIGSIPAELGNLSSLSQLFLHNNVLTDSIPANLGNMSALTNMSLSGNNLSGAIPSTLGNLTNLTSLQLSGNQLTGVIPSTLGNLTSLIYLYLDNNNLSGSIPSSLGNLSSLVRLYLHANSLIGSIPATLRNITTLRQLYLHNNALQSFPDWNGYIHASAMAVSINNNYIPQADIDANLGIFASYIYSLQKTPNGIIGDEIELQALRDLYNSTNGGTWTNNTGWPTTAAEWDAIISVDQIVGWNGIVIANGDITEIRLTGNGLTGSIPNSIGNFLALKKLYLNGNALTGAIPTEIGALTLLENLILNGNQLTGAIPTTIGDLSNLKYLYLAANQLTGNIPESFGNLNTVLQLWLHNNLLEGAIPTTLNNPEIRLNNNNLTGSIPLAFLNNLTLHTLLLNDNSLTGIPDFTAHANAVNLNIDVSNNYLLLADIEQNLKSPDSHPFQTFTYAPQLSPANTVNITLNSDKYIVADRNSVSHPHYQWQKWNGTTWVNEGVNDDHHLPDFAQLIIGDKFRCEITSTWVTGVTNYSSEFVVTQKLNDKPVDFEFKGLYNGNITSMKWRTAAPENVDGEGYTGIYLFDYDNKYQLKEAAWGVDNGPLGIARGTNKFKVKGLTYDANGNIKTLQRYDQYNESSHNFTYDYNLRDVTAPKTNQLEEIAGYASYHYNRIGQLTQEIDKTGAGMHKYIDYDVTGKVVAVYSDATKNAASKKVSYIYDDRGFRLMSKNHETNLETWYIRDASGNVMSIYEKKPDVALVQTEVPVYGSGKVGVYYPQQDGSTAYELTDHLGNVRAVVKNSVTTFTATMEDNGLADYTNPRVEEMQYFENLFTTTMVNVGLGLNHTGTDVVPDPDNATYLTGSPVATTGPTILLKVRTGDGVDARVFGKYKVETSYIEPVNLTSALNNLILNAAGELTLVSAASQIDAVYASVIAAGTQTAVLPAAGLTLIYFNSDFSSNTILTDPLETAGFTTEAEAAATSWEQLSQAFTAPGDGYVMVYVDNASPNTEVYFDDLEVKLTQKGIVTQATDYYAFGSVARRANTPNAYFESSDATAADSDGKAFGQYYRYGYQGEFSEEDEETGWNSFELRMLDSNIGRWTSIDPAGQFVSPYLAMANNPINGTDPDGAYFFGLFGSTSAQRQRARADAAAVGGSVVNITSANGIGVSKVTDFYNNPLKGPYNATAHLLEWSYNKDGSVSNFEISDILSSTLATGDLGGSLFADLGEELVLSFPIIGGARWANRGFKWLTRGGKSFSQYKRLYWSTRLKPAARTIRHNGRTYKVWNELHHRFIPQRAKWAPNWLKNNRFNLQPLNSIQHGIRDPFRFQFFPRWMKNEIKNGNNFGF
jgi:RHS repeat-associated protein